MEGFAVDIGFGRCICVECYPSRKVVELNSYRLFPNSVTAKVSFGSIKIPIQSWKKLMVHFDELNKELADDFEKDIDIRIDLGRKLIVTFVSPVDCFHIRKYYPHKETKEWKPSYPGICLKMPELIEFIKLIPKINSTLDIQSVELCCTKENQDKCEVCNPKGMYSDVKEYI